MGKKCSPNCDGDSRPNAARCAYSNLTLDAALRRNELPARDAALVSALVYGVEERLYTIDYQLSLYLKQPLKKLKPEVLAALRLGVCQLLFMERIPSSAAVCVECFPCQAKRLRLCCRAGQCCASKGERCGDLPAGAGGRCASDAFHPLFFSRMVD